jgi:hypothetical protein
MRKVGWAVLATFAFSSAAAAQVPNGAWADKLFGGAVTHDFGVVPRGAQLKYSFKMVNIYKVPLTITDVRVSCGCVKAEPTTKVLQPNESGQVNITMDARQFNGQKSVRIYITVGPQWISTAALTVLANARGDVVFSPNEIDFSTTQQGEKPARSIDVEYAGTFGDWRVTEIVKNSSAPFDLKVEELPRGAGGVARRGYRIVATVKPDAPAGTFKQEVILKTNDPSNSALTFQIVGNVQAGLAVTPNPIFVSGLRVGDSQTKKVIIRASRPFSIKGIDGQGDGITVADVSTKQDRTQVLTINIQPSHEGTIRRQLTIRTDLQNETTSLMVEAVIEP